MAGITNTIEYEKEAPQLFVELRIKAMSLTGSKQAVDEILKSVNEAEQHFNNKEIPSSIQKYTEASSKVESLVNSLAWRLLCIELGYLVVLLILAYSIHRWPDFTIWKNLIIDLHLKCVWFGALGGLTIAIYGIYKHIQIRDFDPAFQLWYICKPITGGIFGWFFFLVYYVGLISVQGLQNFSVKTPEFPYVIAFLAGFSERFTVRIIDKLMSVLTTWEGEKQATGSEQQKKSGDEGTTPVIT